MLYGYLNSPFVSNPFSDAAIPPSSVVFPVISGSGVIGQTLSTTNGTWSGTLPITYTYQWNRNGSVILGATFNTYTLVTADGSTSITCTVTATNAGGSVSKSSNAISVAAATDADAQAFITAAAITDATQKRAIDKLVVDLKGYGIWSKMKGLYPFVGGTAASHKFNLKNPLDTNAAFRLVFNGGWTHSSNGALPNGTNAYANTFFNPTTQALSKDSTHISYYRRNTSATSKVLMSAMSVGTYLIRLNLAPDYGSGLGNISEIVSQTDQQNTTAISDLGLLIGNRISSAQFKIFANSTLKQTVARTSSTQVNANIYISSENYTGTPGAYTNNQTAFNSIGDGLTDTEAANYYTAVQAFQTTLGRNV
jgi:hypothetical protein